MIKIDEVVIVEGKYDKIKLSSMIDATIIETNGFSIFSDDKKLNMIRTLAEKRGILILTDSDMAGFKIRHYLTGSIDPVLIKHAYIPDILGKEKRKREASKEGKLGVEGVGRELILKALEHSGVKEAENKIKSREITKVDLYEDGLSGTKNSYQLRKKLLKSLDLPERLSSNALLSVLNKLISYEEYQKHIENIKAQKENS